MYCINNNDNDVIMIFNFNLITSIKYHIIVILLNLLPLQLMKKIAYVKSNKNSILVDHEKNNLCDSHIVEFFHDASENYYE